VIIRVTVWLAVVTSAVSWLYWAVVWYILVWRFDYAYGWPAKVVMLTGLTYGV